MSGWVVLGWIGSNVVALLVGIYGERWRLRTSDRAQERRQRVRAALALIDQIDGHLRKIEGRFAVPPRSGAVIHLDRNGRLTGCTEMPGVGNFGTEIALAQAVDAASERRSPWARRAITRRLIELCGRVPYDVRGFWPGNALTFAGIAASWWRPGESYRPEDLSGLIGAALTSGSPPEAVPEARAELRRLRRVVDR